MNLKNNLVKRIITASVLISAVLIVFYLRTIDVRYFNLLIYISSLVGTYEMLRAANKRISFIQQLIIVLFALSFVPIFAFFGENIAYMVAFLALVLCAFTLVFEFDKATTEGVGLSFFTMLYPTLFMIPLMLLNTMGNHSLIALVLVFVIAPLTDTFAYFVGSTIKGRKLCEKISPKKTVSGAVGGIFGGGLGAIVVWIFFRGQLVSDIAVEILIYLIMGFIGAAVSEIGDLLEGAIKRKLEIKDMGSILPGHGGVLDRIDGLIASAVFIYFIFLFLV